MIVVDTNLVVYFWISGERTAHAEAVLRRDAAWAAPVLWRSEFRSALIRLVRLQAVTLDFAHDVVTRAEQAMSGREYSVVSHRVLTLAERSGCSAYDCEFVALAADLGVPLVTSDAHVLRAFPDRAVSPEVFSV
ncbi:MAG TPA: type II toxin-antitoxin system VapC family toxin [Methylomirabilota bacterium]|nr:type II toxin-antitoxin system VapC family toxin [Methylomirabilota bacterium]